jgi:hypothetical protein
LQAKKIELDEREYGKNPLSGTELREIVGNEAIEKFLNPRTSLYRERKIKGRLPKTRRSNSRSKAPIFSSGR